MTVSYDKKEKLEKTGRKLYFDGASNILGHEIGGVLVTSKGKYCPFMTRLDFNYTNNVAEYEACVMGLHAAIDKEVKELKVYGDSALVIYQLQREWETREPRLILYHKYVTGMIKHFEEINFNHLSQEKN